MTERRVIETADGFDQHRDNGLIFEDADGDVFRYETLENAVGEPWLSEFGDEMGTFLGRPTYPVTVLREGYDARRLV